MVETLFRDDDTTTDIVDLSSQPALLSADPADRPKLLNLNDPFSKPTDSGLPQPDCPAIPTPFHLVSKPLVPFKES